MADKMHIPAPLHELCQWVCWGKPGEANRKCPYDPRTGQRAKAGVPDTWAAFSEAVGAVQAGRYEGIGFEFAGDGGIVGVDFDHCIQGGALDAWAADWVRRFDSYTEVSPSGEGLHILCKGILPANIKRPRAEMYDRARYFTFTGKAWDGAPKPIRDAQEDVDALYRELQADAAKGQQTPAQPAPALPSGDKDYLAIGLEKDTRFAALWNGERPNGNESTDDMALMNKLAYWCNADFAAMRDAFFTSPHCQGKDEAHRKKLLRKDYLPRTIDIAVKSCARTAAGDDADYKERRSQSRGEGRALDWEGAIGAPGDAAAPQSGTAPQPPRTGKAAHRPALIPASAVPYEPPRWTLAPYFQRGKGTLIQGDNGTGKTAFMCAIAAHVSTGRPLLDMPIEAPGNVIILSVEDDLAVLRGRIEEDGGDLSRCHFVTNAAGLTFASPEIEAMIRQVGAKLILFDPFQAFLGAGVDMFRPNETRPQLAKLFDTCEREDCACAIIAHTVKSAGDKSPVNRSLGSVDIPASMRSILHLIRNPDNEEECVMLHVKCSNAPKGKSLVYTIGKRGGVHWKGFSELTADDLTAIVKRKEKGIPYEREPLVQVLNQLITDKPEGGFWSYEDVKNTGAKMLGFPPFYSTADLKAKLSGPLLRELQQNDGLIVTVGHRRKDARGICIERYEVPKEYQAKMDD